MIQTRRDNFRGLDSPSDGWPVAQKPYYFEMPFDG